MKRITALMIAALILSPATVLSQTRKRTSKTPAQVTKPSEKQRQGATRVADEIKTLSRYLYLLGAVAKGIEAMDDAARRGEASPELVQQADKNKLTVRSSIRSFKERLDKLEIDFRTTPELQRYYIKLAGVAAGAATAEDLAAANQFDRAGRTLLDVVNRLTDVLLEMQAA